MRVIPWLNRHGLLFLVNFWVLQMLMRTLLCISSILKMTTMKKELERVVRARVSLQGFLV